MQGKATSSSGGAPAQLEAEAFLSHSSEQKDFVQVLGDKLTARGLKYFSSAEEHTGCEKGKPFDQSLLKHVRAAKVVVLVLSQEFFSSKWCIRELAEALAVQQANSTKVLLPVFWDKAEDLESWVQQQQQQDFMTTCLGGQASHHISCNSIFRIQGIVFRQGNTLVQLADSVFREVLPHIYFPEFDEHNIMSADSWVEWAIVHLVQQDGRLGITGMGGRGKTTLAQLLYNRLYARFNGRVVYLQVDSRDCGEAAAAGSAGLRGGVINDMLSLQQKMLKLLGADNKQLEHITDAQQGQGKIRQALQQKGTRHLIILDNVWDAGVGHLLLPTGTADTFSSDGSWVVVTSRHSGVVTSLLGTETARELPELDLLSQLQLLHLSAGSHLKGFSSAEEQYLLGLCHGLPLKVKLLAGIFRGCQTLEAAKCQLEEIKRIGRIPGGLDTVFLFSYQALEPPSLQTAFLNVALFLPQRFQCDTGILKSHASRWVRMLDDDCPVNWLDKLADRSMVTLKESEDASQFVMVHDALVEFAAEYIAKQSRTIVPCSEQSIILSQTCPWPSRSDFAPCRLAAKEHADIISSASHLFKQSTWLHHYLFCLVRPFPRTRCIWRPAAQLSNLVLLRLDSDVLLILRIKALDLSSLAHLKLLWIESVHLQHMQLPASLQVLLLQSARYFRKHYSRCHPSGQLQCIYKSCT